MFSLGFVSCSPESQATGSAYDSQKIPKRHTVSWKEAEKMVKCNERQGSRTACVFLWAVFPLRIQKRQRELRGEEK